MQLDCFNHKFARAAEEKFFLQKDSKIMISFDASVLIVFLLNYYQSFISLSSVRKLQHSSQKSKEMRMTDMKSEPVMDSSTQYSDNSKSSGTENGFLLYTTHFVNTLLTVPLCSVFFKTLMKVTVTMLRTILDKRCVRPSRKQNVNQRFPRQRGQ